MPAFVIGSLVETVVPTVEVTVDAQNPLPVGKHTFQLIVEDDAGNKSMPATVDVFVKDLTNPTAVLKAPPQVNFGTSFFLDGRESSDPPPGKVMKWFWTKVG